MTIKECLVLLTIALLPAACGRGPKGDTGDPGQSIVGPAGQDAASVTVVQLCHGTAHYPTVFPEVAFCIGGKLYATYSANGGFSTELTPGAYSSHAIGSSCSFVVQSNCVVVQQ